MTDDRFARLKQVLAHALELPEAERDGYLTSACAGDPGLRAEVERILASARSDAPGLRTGGLDDVVRAAFQTQADVTPEEAPTTIGPYRIVRALGEGGMGTVYLAEQERPMRRQVALKLIKLGMDSREVIARFEAERQALALMEHPHISRVFEAGTSEQGRPYFAMEYAPGEPITEYCDRTRLSIAERLELFATVCLALHHAHQKGIIHRDVKPSNILVTEHEGRPVPKVIDFGVAKATNQRLTERSMLTERGQLIGTPEYMSPEQVESPTRDVDTTSDVYSLGVLLYELLTGALPFDRDELRRGAWNTIQRRIRESEPPRPSDRVTTLAETGHDVARRRRVSPSGLRRQLRGDLDWVVMKAMEKDRSRRYASASEFAADVQRYLRHEPVLAGPPSLTYRLRKLTRRHRTAVVVAATIVVSLTLALVESNRQRRIAERARDESEAVTRFLAQTLAAADPRHRGRTTPVGDVLDEAARSIETEFARQPLVEAELRVTIGNAYRALGDLAAARPHLERGVALRRRILGAEHHLTLTAVNDLAILAQKQGHSEEAERLHARVLEVQRRTLGDRHPETLDTKSNLASAWMDLGRRAEAAALFREALDGQLRVAGEESRETLGSMHNLAELYRELGQYDRSESLHVRVLGVQQRMLGPTHPELLISLNSLAVLYKATARYAEAGSLLTRTVAIRRQVLGDEHPETLTALNNLATLYSEAQRHDEAAAMHRTILDARRRLLGLEHPHTLISMGNLGEALTAAGRPADGESLLASATKTAGRALGQDHAIHAVTLRKLGVCLGRLGRYDEAEAALRRARGILERTLGAKHERTLLAEEDLADLQRARGMPGPTAAR